MNLQKKKKEKKLTFHFHEDGKQSQYHFLRNPNKQNNPLVPLNQIRFQLLLLFGIQDPGSYPMILILERENQRTPVLFFLNKKKGTKRKEQKERNKKKRTKRTNVFLGKKKGKKRLKEKTRWPLGEIFTFPAAERGELPTKKRCCCRTNSFSPSPKKSSSFPIFLFFLFFFFRNSLKLKKKKSF